MRWPLEARRGDLAGIANITRGSVTATDVTGIAQLSLRADPGIVGRLPLPVPTEPNTVARSGSHDVLWLGPDEWLVVTEEDPEQLASTVRAALRGAHHAIVDVSANRAVIALTGAGRHGILASRCSIDLHERSWRDGSCAQTLLGRAQVLLQERNDETRLFVRPSFGGYVVDLLVDSATTSSW
jgi:sarcosine oxidase subunit gamma